jgi:hypothetical protein
MKKKSHKTKKSTNTLQEIKQVEKILKYFVAEGIAEEVSEGKYILTEEGKKLGLSQQKDLLK